MSLPLSLLICLSVFHLCLGVGPEEQVIIAKKVHLLGGWHEKSPESEDVQKAAQYAVEMYNENPEEKNLYKMISVTSAETQVTNMINFKMNATLGRTKCLKKKKTGLKKCILGNQQVKCQFHVTFSPHTKKYKLDTKKCYKTVKKG